MRLGILGASAPLVGLVMAPGSGARANPVFVRAGKERGQGFARWYGEDCLVILPDHVARSRAVTPPTPRTPITLTGPRGLTSEAVFAEGFGNDLATLRVERNRSGFCDRESDLDIALGGPRDFVLVIRTAAGSVRPIPVRATDIGQRTLRVSALDADDRLQPGMSGGSLYRASSSTACSRQWTARRGRAGSSASGSSPGS